MTRFLLLAQQVADEAAPREMSWAVLAEPASRLMVAAALAVVGIWLMLPTGTADWRRTGMAVTTAAGCLFVSLVQPMGNLLATGTFSVLLGITIVAGFAIGTLFTLFVLPVIYTFFAGDRRPRPTAVPAPA